MLKGILDKISSNKFKNPQKTFKNLQIIKKTIFQKKTQMQANQQKFTFLQDV